MAFNPNYTRDDINWYLEQTDQTAVLMDGFEHAIIGFSQRINEPLLAVYNHERMIQTLMQRDGMTYQEADEYIEYNCIGAWIGEQTPIIVKPIAM